MSIPSEILRIANVKNAIVQHLTSLGIVVPENATFEEIAEMVEELGTGGFSGSYNDLTDVPTSFNPSAHTHPARQITGLEAIATSGDAADVTYYGTDGYTKTVEDVIDELYTGLSGKANSVHSHAQSDINGLQSELEGKANRSHTHVVADVTGLTDEIAAFTSGKCTSYVFDTTADLDSWLETADKSTLKTGDVFLIRAVDVPDYWWDATTQTKQILETTKVNLSEYALASSVPTKLSDLTADSTHRIVTDEEKTTWNSKANGVHSHAQSDINGLVDALSDLTGQVANAKELLLITADLTFTVNGLDISNLSHTYAEVMQATRDGKNVVLRVEVIDEGDEDAFLFFNLAMTEDNVIVFIANIGENFTFLVTLNSDNTVEIEYDELYTHPESHPASMITGLATVATSGSYTDLSNTPDSLPANGGNSDTVDGYHIVVSSSPPAAGTENNIITFVV